MLRLKMLKIFIQASLIGMFMWAKFQAQIRKYDFAGKSESSKDIPVKHLYLSQIATWAHILLGFF